MEIYKMFKTTMSALLAVGIVATDIPSNMRGGVSAMLVAQAAETDPNDLAVSSPLTKEQQREITFDACFYANMNPDVKAVYGYDAQALYRHYLNWGIQEGRIASPVFDPAYYLQVQTDLKAAFGNDYVAAYRHWLQYGYLEERESSKYYDGRYYRENNGDLAGMDSYGLLHHFLTFGMTEDRITTPTYTQLDASLCKAYYPAYQGNSGSIAIALDELGVDSGFEHRKEIAAANGIEGDCSNESQNNQLLKLLRQGKLVDPETTEEAKKFIETIALNVPIYKQGKERWSATKIGSKTIAQAGCLICSLAMKYSYQTNTTVYPDTMRKMLSFDGNNLKWDPMEKALGYRYTRNYSTTITNDIMKRIYEKLREGTPVIIGGKGNTTHWIVITGYTGSDTENFNAAEFTVNDPAGYNAKTLEEFLKQFPTVLRLVY